MRKPIDYTKTYTNHIQNQIDEDPLLRPYFVTVSFIDFQTKTQQSTQVTEKKITEVWVRYNQFYRHVVSNLMTNFTKKLYLHPKTYDFIDFPGTRHSRRSTFYEPQTPHVHSIYLIHPETLNQFKKLVETDFEKIAFHDALWFVQSVHAAPITHDLGRVVSYSSKFLNDYRSRVLHPTVPLFNQYPIAKSEMKDRSNPEERFYVDTKQKLLNKSKRVIRQRFSHLNQPPPIELPKYQ